ncbi:hypothetical protein BgAZ_302930 [Babesia gibsoni]|uniref:Uncharacterized protein n=1 Tax=Babesia gibsoni TaxID=33632 RepID=A0AAD8LHJ2_BABGI|nr:hypothetical protein BgAZ_302930 [Babesia gibsoni]
MSSDITHTDSLMSVSKTDSAVYYECAAAPMFITSGEAIENAQMKKIEDVDVILDTRSNILYIYSDDVERAQRMFLYAPPVEAAPTTWRRWRSCVHVLVSYVGTTLVVILGVGYILYICSILYRWG